MIPSNLKDKRVLNMPHFILGIYSGITGLFHLINGGANEKENN